MTFICSQFWVGNVYNCDRATFCSISSIVTCSIRVGLRGEPTEKVLNFQSRSWIFLRASFQIWKGRSYVRVCDGFPAPLARASLFWLFAHSVLNHSVCLAGQFSSKLKSYRLFVHDKPRNEVSRFGRSLGRLARVYSVWLSGGRRPSAGHF